MISSSLELELLEVVLVALRRRNSLSSLVDGPEIRFGGTGQNDTRAFAVMVQIPKSLPMPPYSAPRPIAPPDANLTPTPAVARADQPCKSGIEASGIPPAATIASALS